MWKEIIRLYSPLISNIWLYFGLFAMALEAVTSYFVGRLPSKMYLTLIGNDQKGFIYWSMIGVGLLLGNAFIIALKKFLMSLTYINFRRTLTDFCLSRYFSGLNFYNLSWSTIDNSDQRLTMDVERFSRLSIEMFTTIALLPFTISFYMYKCISVTSWVGPVTCLTVFAVGSICHRCLLSMVVKWSKEVEAKEGDYRWKHAKIRTHAESIAMAGASSTESSRTTEEGKKLFITQTSHAGRAFFLNWSVNLFEYIGGYVPYFCLAPFVFGGAYDDLDDAELAELISKSSFEIIMLVYQFTQLLHQVTTISDIIACGERISELVDFCNKNRGQNNSSYMKSFDTVSSSRDDFSNEKLDSKFEIKNLDVTAGKKTLIQDLCLTIGSNENLMITGPNGAGKSSLLRVCSGLWKVPSFSKVILPRKSMFLSQQSYVTGGTLLSQVAFPAEEENSFCRNQAERALGKVGLDQYVSFLDTKDNWGQLLSFGQQQKLVLARVFYHQPKLVFLDESTSGLPEEDEGRIYENLIEDKIKFISVVHRSNLKKFHEKELRLLPTGNHQIF